MIEREARKFSGAMLIVVGLMLVLGPSALLLFWVFLGGWRDVFREFNAVYVLFYLGVVVGGIALCIRGSRLLSLKGRC